MRAAAAAAAELTAATWLMAWCRVLFDIDEEDEAEDDEDEEEEEEDDDDDDEEGVGFWNEFKW